MGKHEFILNNPEWILGPLKGLLERPLVSQMRNLNIAIEPNAE